MSLRSLGASDPRHWIPKKAGLQQGCQKPIFVAFRFYEAEDNPRIKHTKKGLISMVNCGDGMLGSQFFVTLGNIINSTCIFGSDM